MEEAIRNFHTQFLWKPEVVHADKLPRFNPNDSAKGGVVRVRKFIFDGMGGSHLAADLLRLFRPALDLSIFSDYGLPNLSSARLQDSLFIASSFSGGTEETIDFAEHALKKRLPLAAICKGSTLLAFAREHKLPHVVLPSTSIQPRSGLGFQMLALAALLGDTKLLKELHKLASTLKPGTLEKQGKALAKKLLRKVPIVYSSSQNSAIAYNWKIKFNETGKIPAFHNIFPELNHNEMTGFDTIKSTQKLSKGFHFIFLTDGEDHPKVQKRMKVTRKLYEAHGLSVTSVPIAGASALEKIFNSLLLADWTALHLSRVYGTEAEQVPMVERFKKSIS